MCNECVELDKTIARYREIIRQALDALTSDRLNEAIAEMQQRKVALHPVA